MSTVNPNDLMSTVNPNDLSTPERRAETAKRLGLPVNILLIESAEIAVIKAELVRLRTELADARRERDEARNLAVEIDKARWTHKETLTALRAENVGLREAILSVLCDPEGVPCFQGSDGDRKVIAVALAQTADLAGKPASDKWLVWSNEHGAWWGPNNCGYYTDIRSAGRYTKEQAEENASSRSLVKGRLPPEVIISEQDAMAGKDPNARQPKDAT